MALVFEWVWSRLVSLHQGFAAAGDRKNAKSLSKEMKDSGVGMDVVSYGTAVGACGRAGDVKGAMRLIEASRGYHG